MSGSKPRYTVAELEELWKQHDKLRAEAVAKLKAEEEAKAKAEREKDENWEPRFLTCSHQNGTQGTVICDIGRHYKGDYAVTWLKHGVSVDADNTIARLLKEKPAEFKLAWVRSEYINGQPDPRLLPPPSEPTAAKEAASKVSKKRIDPTIVAECRECEDEDMVYVIDGEARSHCCDARIKVPSDVGMRSKLAILMNGPDVQIEHPRPTFGDDYEVINIESPNVPPRPSRLGGFASGVANLLREYGPSKQDMLADLSRVAIGFAAHHVATSPTVRKRIGNAVLALTGSANPPELQQLTAGLGQVLMIEEQPPVVDELAELKQQLRDNIERVERAERAINNSKPAAPIADGGTATPAVVTEAAVAQVAPGAADAVVHAADQG